MLSAHRKDRLRFDLAIRVEIPEFADGFIIFEAAFIFQFPLLIQFFPKPLFFPFGIGLVDSIVRLSL